jgi:hypothetical protein
VGLQVVIFANISRFFRLIELEIWHGNTSRHEIPKATILNKSKTKLSGGFYGCHKAESIFWI